MKHAASLFALLALTWWLLSGHAGALLLGLGLASTLFVVLLARRMDVVDHESHPVHMSWRLVRFWAWLMREIVVANLQVVRLVLSPRPALAPSLFRVTSRQTSELGKVILGNAITLTPGTVTLDIEGDTLVVHALTEASAEDVRRGSIDRRVPRDVEDTDNDGGDAAAREGGIDADHGGRP